MTLTKANEDFILHSSVCKTCGSNGGAVCRIGMEIQRAFHAVIVLTKIRKHRPELWAQIKDFAEQEKR